LLLTGNTHFLPWSTLAVVAGFRATRPNDPDLGPLAEKASIMSDLPNFKALLSDDVLRAVLRADGIEPRDFLRTLEGAATRIRASKDLRHAKAVRMPSLDPRQACRDALRSMTLSRCGA
jgi:hypothetical protein